MLFYIFFWINYVYNKYIIAYDTNSLFFAVKDNETKKIEIKIESNKNFSTNNDDIIISANLKKPLQKYISLQGMNKQKTALLKSNNNNNNKNNNTKSKFFKKELLYAKNLDKRRKSDNINQNNKKKNYYYLSAIKFSKDISNNDMNYCNLKLGESNNNLIFNKDIKDIHLGNFNSGRVGGRNSNIFF